MDDQFNETDDRRAPESQDRPSTHADRRDFIKGATAGVLSTIAATSLSGTSAMAQVPGIVHQGPSQDPIRPKGLSRRGMVDQRFAVAYATSMPQGVSIVTQFFTAIQERNYKGMADVMHFPFGSIEHTEAVKVDTPQQLMSAPPPSLNMNEKPGERYSANDGYLQPGAYDVFEGLEILCVDPVNCTLAMTYNRYNAHGSRLHRVEGIYTVSNNDGRWALQAMSTIITPDRMIGMKYQDVLDAVIRDRIDHDLSFQVSDRYQEAKTTVKGSSIGVSEGGSVWNLGPAGKIMDAYKVVGVKSRLTYTPPANVPGYTPAPPPDPNKTREQELEDYAAYRKLMGSTTGEEWGWVYGAIPETRVLHHTVNKAHRFSAATRFTASGEQISTNTDVAALMFRKRQWVSVGHFAYTTPHDRANSVEVPGPLYTPPANRGTGQRGQRGR